MLASSLEDQSQEGSVILHKVAVQLIQASHSSSDSLLSPDDIVA